MNAKNKIATIIYCLINFLFIWKYGSRQEYIPVILGLFGFSLLVFLITKLHNLLNSYWLLACLATLLAIGINIYVDCESLTVDRCSAMSVSIQDILLGNYPYDAIDHMGGRSSHLPGIFILAIPFYLMGDVGFLQVGSLLLFAYALKINLKKATLPLLLLLVSPAYWWEVYTKSDLLSNFLIIASTYLIFQKHHSKINPIWLGFSLAILCFTRFTTVIPLSILFIPYLLKMNIPRIIIGSGIGIIVMILLVQPWTTDMDTLTLQNPLELQNRFVPLWLSIGVFLSAMYVALKRNIAYTPYELIALLLLIPVLFSFGINISEGSLNNSVMNSSFDISYFNMVLPFIILWISTSSLKLSVSQ